MNILSKKTLATVNSLQKELNNINNIISEKEKKIEGFNLLTENELHIIIRNMDKNDYRKFGNYPRWLDLERIIKSIIDIKNIYPNWILTNLSSDLQYQTIPPQNFYNYEYKDGNNKYFNKKFVKKLNKLNNILFYSIQIK